MTLEANGNGKSFKRKNTTLFFLTAFVFTPIVTSVYLSASNITFDSPLYLVLAYGVSFMIIVPAALFKFKERANIRVEKIRFVDEKSVELTSFSFLNTSSKEKTVSLDVLGVSVEKKGDETIKLKLTELAKPKLLSNNSRKRLHIFLLVESFFDAQDWEKIRDHFYK
ncbi:MAG: hypothetical protein AAF992_12200 [Bacteroidota bacterium]